MLIIWYVASKTTFLTQDLRFKVKWVNEQFCENLDDKYYLHYTLHLIFNLDPRFMDLKFITPFHDMNKCIDYLKSQLLLSTFLNTRAFFREENIMSSLSRHGGRRLIYMFSRPKRKVLAIYLGFIIASLRNILAIIRAALVAIISSKHYMMRMILPHSGSLVIKTVSYVIILDFRVAMSSRYYSDNMYGN